MCGIVFLYDQNSDPLSLEARVNQSLDLLIHRGPDESGYWHKQSTAIGHRRLSILDIANSQQPMCDPAGRYVLTFNGEIYNFRELRKELINKWDFRTKGDTEVLLAGLVIQGDKFIKQLEGMWGFAFWDSHAKTLLMSRDRLGKKPLYYQSNNYCFSCASELRALAVLTNISWEEDTKSTADYFRYGYYLPGTTAYRKVYEVLPGHNLCWSPGNQPTSNSYWSLTIGEFNGNKATATNLLREKIISAVKKRTIADVEVGALLSGGIDSSLIVGVLTKELSIKTKTFTIGFSDKTFDERKYAGIVATQWGTEHYSDCLDSWNRNKLIKIIQEHVGQPFADSSILPALLVSELASQSVKVILSGDGGDEVFSGYQRYQARVLLQWYSRLPKFLRSNIEKLIRRLPEPMAHHSHSLLKKAHLFLKFSDQLESGNRYIAPMLCTPKDLNLLLPEISDKGHLPIGLPDDTGPDALTEMMLRDSLIYLPQDILSKIDRATMSASVEARCPFLDREVIELAFSLPRKWHRSLDRGKKLLHNAFPDLLLPAIRRRRKQGFSVPVYKWFYNALANDLMELLANTVGIPLSDTYVTKLLDEHRSHQRDHSHRLWAIYVYLLWRKHGFPSVGQ